MKYPDYFKAAVKAVFPDSADLHIALDNNSEWVGRYLDDSRIWNIKPFEIVEMIDLGKIDELREEALRQATVSDLYLQWCKLYDQCH